MCIGAGPDATSDAMAPLLKRKNSGGLDGHDLQCDTVEAAAPRYSGAAGQKFAGEIDMSRRIARAKKRSAIHWAGLSSPS